MRRKGADEAPTTFWKSAPKPGKQYLSLASHRFLPLRASRSRRHWLELKSTTTLARTWHDGNRCCRHQHKVTPPVKDSKLTPAQSSRLGLRRFTPLSSHVPVSPLRQVCGYSQKLFIPSRNAQALDVTPAASDPANTAGIKSSNFSKLVAEQA